MQRHRPTPLLCARIALVALLFFSLTHTACEEESPSPENTTAQASGATSTPPAQKPDATAIAKEATSDTTAAIPTDETDAAPANTAQPPTPEERAAIMAGVPQDPIPEKLLGPTYASEAFENLHYLAGNESHLELFAPHIQDLGGVYIGVGADQGLILTSWLKPEVAFFIDYDDWVNWVHELHRAFILESPTPDDFWNLWFESKEAKVLVQKAFADHPLGAKHFWDVYKAAKKKVRRRFKALKRDFKANNASPDLFLNSPERYNVLRTMMQEGRVRIMRVNLLEKKGLVGIGEAARQLNLPVRAVYFSNAEQYWKYPDQFRTNMRALPFDERSVILRTLTTTGKNHDFYYNIQPAQEFLEYLKDHDTFPQVHHMVERIDLNHMPQRRFAFLPAPPSDPAVRRAELESRAKAKEERRKKREKRKKKKAKDTTHGD